MLRDCLGGSQNQDRRMQQGLPIMENQMEKKMENEMETGII